MNNEITENFQEAKEILDTLLIEKDKKKNTEVLRKYLNNILEGLLEAPNMVREYPYYLGLALFTQIKFTNIPQWRKWVDGKATSIKDMEKYFTTSNLGAKITSLFKKIDPYLFSQAIALAFLLQNRKKFEITNIEIPSGDIFGDLEEKELTEEREENHE